MFALAGHDPARVSGVSTAEYFAGASGPVAPRPGDSVLDLSKATGAGIAVRDGREALAEYLRG